MWNSSFIAAAIAILSLLTGTVHPPLDQVLGGHSSDTAKILVDGPIEKGSPVAVVDLPDDFRRSVMWAVGLFEEAGLDLPALRYIHHGGDPSPCRGRAGVHHVVGGVSVIELCEPEPSTATEVMILHETAHAWADHNLSDSDKVAFQQLRGFSHWRNYEMAAWHENGTEQAAEILVWGLIDRPIQMIRINDTGCEQLEAGFLVLTGEAPLHGFRDHC